MKAFKPRSHPSAFNSIEWIQAFSPTASDSCYNPFNSIEWIHDSYVRVVGEALELHSFNSIEWIPSVYKHYRPASTCWLSIPLNGFKHSVVIPP